MYTLRLLGTASIETAHGPVSGRAAQGRRLALLALLALARGRPLTRDKLIALLWPEASPERARPQLSDALYVVRSGLGEDVVRVVGDGLTLNPDAITSDVARFESLLADGRPEDAVALYAGPLLDGFHVPDSAGFESWLEGERAQLDRAYAQALDGLAEGAATPDAAVAWWRRRAVHDPYNGRVALNLMRSLAAAGDRAGALQHARIHATLLREEFGTEPAAEVTAFVEQLRLEPPPAPIFERLATSRQPTTSPPTASGSQATTSSSTAPESQLTTSPPSAPGSHAMTSLTGPPGAQQSSSASRHTPAARRVRRHRVLAAAAALVVILAVAVYGVRRANAHPEARSVGVLPFVNMSSDPANTYFSDGLSEQIILALSRIDGLQVAARTSSFALRDRELGVRAIGDTLGVQAVLEGSVLMDGERLRVIAQLIDARTGYHIWSDQYDGHLGDAFGMQDRIAAAIADALHLRLAGGSASAPPSPAPSFEAYDLYLRGLYLRNSLSADALQQAEEYFDRVIALEPRFALAWAAKASVVAPQAYFRYADRDAVVAELRTLTARALELDPSLGEAYASLGILKLFFDWDWRGAEAALRRAIELNPNDAHAWHHLANYHAAVGHIAEAAGARERAVQLDPLNARSRIVLASDHMLAGDPERALAEARRAEQLDPSNPMLLGRGPSLPAGTPAVLRTQGRLEEAVEEYLRVASMRGATAAEIDAMRDAYAAAGITAFWGEWLAMDVRQSGASPDPVRMAATHLLAGDSVLALDWLERAFHERNPGLIYIRRDIAFTPLHDHPRFQRIAAALNFPD